jgi:hypothetical protein
VEKKHNPGRKASRNPRTPKPATKKPTENDALFDTWLENKLKTAYSSVLEEPIPEDLIRLLTQKLKD